MPARSFQARLLYLFIAVLVLLEAGTLISVHLAGQQTLRRSLADELHVGARVLDRIIETRARQLSDSLRVLILDFAFREAVASADLPTVTSALENHGKRIAADAVVLIGLDGTVTADTLGGRMIGRRFPYAQMLRMAEDRGEASGTVSFNNRPYQFVIVPVLAPRPIAWICAGFEIDARVLEDVRQLTSLDVAIWSSTSGSTPQLISTLRTAERNDLTALMEAAAPARNAQAITSLDLGGATYATLLRPLPT